MIPFLPHPRTLDPRAHLLHRELHSVRGRIEVQGVFLENSHGGRLVHPSRWGAEEEELPALDLGLVANPALDVLRPEPDARVLLAVGENGEEHLPGPAGSGQAREASAGPVDGVGHRIV